MSYLTTPRRSPWLELSVDTYLDRRHRTWMRTEELGDVVFISERRVVLVHRERAEGIAAALLGGRDVLMLEDALALPLRPRPSRYACRRLLLPAPPRVARPGGRHQDQPLGASSGAARPRGGRRCAGDGSRRCRWMTLGWRWRRHW